MALFKALAKYLRKNTLSFIFIPVLTIKSGKKKTKFNQRKFNKPQLNAIWQHFGHKIAFTKVLRSNLT